MLKRKRKFQRQELNAKLKLKENMMYGRLRMRLDMFRNV
jgi:hypothetical protein